MLGMHSLVGMGACSIACQRRKQADGAWPGYACQAIACEGTMASLTTAVPAVLSQDLTTAWDPPSGGS